VTVDGTVIKNNTAREGGGAIFFVSDNNTGTLSIENSALRNNPSEGFATAGFPGIFFHSDGTPTVAGSELG
jgi:predicted outer membrane repeat protein